ncbi:MAG TPA: hypothetical protein VKO45_07425 [Methanomicrobiales archaeon]|nr:hypothetical protein [Methanomicrobiales archaeon]
MKRDAFLFVVSTVLITVACGCLIPATHGSQQVPSPIPTVAVPLTIRISATPPRYNPAMSSTIGIRLTPVNTSGIITPDARFTWETTFGSFYRWGPPDFKVTELGARYTGTEEPVYWSYFSELGEKARRPVNITLTVWSQTDRLILANATLRIGWEDRSGFTSVVEGEG